MDAPSSGAPAEDAVEKKDLEKKDDETGFMSHGYWKGKIRVTGHQLVLQSQVLL